MESGNSIDVAELRRLSDRLFKNLERTGIRHISVKRNNYWTIFPNDAFNIDEPSPVLADLVDDLNDLKNETSNAGDDRLTIFWHAFHHLSGLMKLIAFADLQGDLSTSKSARD